MILLEKFKRLDIKIGNKKQIIFVILLIITVIIVNLIIKYRKSGETKEGFAVLTEVQDLATNNVDAVLNSTNQVKFANSSVGSYFSGSSSGNSLTDIFNDIYGKIGVISDDVGALNSKMPEFVSLLNTANTNVNTATASMNSSNTTLMNLTKLVDTANTNAIDALGQVPVGTIIPYNKTTLPADNTWVLCDGGTYSFTDVFGTTNSFTAPDLSTRFIIGAGTNNNTGTTYSVGSVGGEEKHVLTLDEMPPHQHTNPFVYGLPPVGRMGDYAYVNTDNSVGLFAYTSWTGGDPDGAKTKNTQFSTMLGQPVYNSVAKAHNNMPPYYALYYIIKISANPVKQMVQTKAGSGMAKVPKSSVSVNTTTPNVPVTTGANTNVQQVLAQTGQQISQALRF